MDNQPRPSFDEAISLRCNDNPLTFSLLNTPFEPPEPVSEGSSCTLVDEVQDGEECVASTPYDGEERVVGTPSPVLQYYAGRLPRTLAAFQDAFEVWMVRHGREIVEKAVEKAVENAVERVVEKAVEKMWEVKQEKEDEERWVEKEKKFEEVTIVEDSQGWTDDDEL
jgi:hypothetical protein